MRAAAALLAFAATLAAARAAGAAPEAPADPAPALEAPSDPAPAAAPAPEALEALSAEQWIERMSEALGARSALAARGRMRVDVPRRETWGFEIEYLRIAEAGGVRTLFEMRESPSEPSVVSELLAPSEGELTNWYWDVRARRFQRISGILATDRFAETDFRYEDLGLADPAARRRGSVRWTEGEGGRREVHVTSAPYHYYARVVTALDPATALPLRVTFYDHTGAPIREQRFEQVRTLDGHPFPSRVRIRDLVSGAESVLEYDEVRFLPRIAPSYFDLEVIDGKIRKGGDPVPVPPPG